MAPRASRSCVLAGLSRFGFIADLLSKPVRYGYMNGIALTVLLSQVPKLFGFSIDAEGLIPEAQALVRGVAEGETNRAALIIGVACLLVILVFKRWRPRVPGVLVAVVGATVAVGVFGLAERYDLSVVGALPRVSRRSRFPASRSTTSRPSWPAPSGSPWSRSPTPASSREPSPSEVATGSTRTRNWSRSGRRTSPGASSKGSR